MLYFRVSDFGLTRFTAVSIFIKLAINRPSVKNSDRTAPIERIRPINPPIDDKKSTNVYSVISI